MNSATLERAKNYIDNAFLRYIGSGEHLYIYYVCLAILLFIAWKEKDKVLKRLFLFGIFIMIIVRWSVTAAKIQEYIGEYVYTRMIWAYPIIIVMALVMCKIISSQSDRLYKIITLVLFIFVIMFTGTNILSKAYYIKETNISGIPQYVIEIDEIIWKDAKERGLEDVYMISEASVALRINMYDRKKYTPYTRYGDKSFLSLMERCNEDRGKTLINTAIQRNMNYIVLHSYRNISYAVDEGLVELVGCYENILVYYIVHDK